MGIETPGLQLSNELFASLVAVLKLPNMSGTKVTSLLVGKGLITDPPIKQCCIENQLNVRC